MVQLHRSGGNDDARLVVEGVETPRYACYTAHVPLDYDLKYAGWKVAGARTCVQSRECTLVVRCSTARK